MGEVAPEFSVEERLDASAAVAAASSWSYEAAMGVLSSLITQKSRGHVTKAAHALPKLERMRRYLEILDLEGHLSELKIIHVAGTKGKGSTCMFCESILRSCGFRTGTFTSPHLIDVRERFRLNGLEISEEKFLRHLWDCFYQLKEKVTTDLPMPGLFQFLTLLAFKIFLSEKVDVAIIEVGIGGTNDTTNVIREPVVCGITSLGLDHMEILGDTLAEIASHKAGIFKERVPSFTVLQSLDAMHVLQERATSVKIHLQLASPLDPVKLLGQKLGLDGDHQLINAGLAVALCQCWLEKSGNSKKTIPKECTDGCLPKPFLEGLSTTNFPGRAQVVCDMPERHGKLFGSDDSYSGGLIFYLDGAHTLESMELCAKWFSDRVKDEMTCASDLQNNSTSCNGSTKITKHIKHILLFNCMEVRDPNLLLPKLKETCASRGVSFSKALFVPSISSYSKVNSDVSLASLYTLKNSAWQRTLQATWEKITHGTGNIYNDNRNLEIPQNLPSYSFLYEDMSKRRPVNNCFGSGAVIPSLPSAINWLRACVKENPSFHIQVLVTGSLHLVGDVLKLLRR